MAFKVCPSADKNSNGFPFLHLPLDLQMEIRDRLEVNDLINLVRVSKSTAELVDQRLIIQQVESQLREYLEPRELFSIATCRSVLTLCGFNTTRQGAKPAASGRHVKFMKDLVAADNCYSWEGSYLRFILVALSPYRVLFSKYASRYMTQDRLRDFTIAELHTRATQILTESKTAPHNPDTSGQRNLKTTELLSEHRRRGDSFEKELDFLLTQHVLYYLMEELDKNPIFCGYV